MINLRYHIVSIVGVFLALGIGVALGSTFIDGLVVAELEQRVDNIEEDRNNLRDDLDTARDELAGVVAAQAAQEVAAIPLLGGGRLTDVPVMIIAAEGVDPDAFQTIRAAILGSDAQYEGTLWLTDRLNLSDQDNRADVAATFGLVDDAETLVRVALETRLVSALFPPAPEEAGNVLGGTAADIAGELLASADSELSVGAPLAQGNLDSVLTQLRDAAFVVYDNEFATTGALDEVPAHGTRFVLVSNADADLDPREIFVPLFDAVVEDGIDVTIVALEPAPLDDNANPTEFVSLIRSDPDYSALFATVDHATTFNGTLSALVVTDTRDVLHLGTGRDAVAELPPA